MDFLLELAWKNVAVAGVLAVAAAIISRLVRRPAVTHGLWLIGFSAGNAPIWHVPVLWSTVESTTEAPSQFAPYSPTELDVQPGTKHSLAASIDKGTNNALSSDSEVTPTSEKATSGNPEGLPATGLAVSLSIARAAEVLNQARESEPQPIRPSITWKQTVIGVWVAGCCIWASVLLVRLRRFRRLARLARPASAADCHRLHELADAIGLKKAPALRLLSARVPPMTWGLANGYEVIVPTDLWNSLSPTARRRPVARLAHLRRGDHWVRPSSCWFSRCTGGIRVMVGTSRTPKSRRRMLRRLGCARNARDCSALCRADR